MLKKSVKNAWAKKASKKVTFVQCVDCGKLIRKGEQFVGADGKNYCAEHFDERFTTCANCGDVIYLDKAHEVNGETYCDTCFDEEYVVCYDCGKIIRRGDALEGADEELYCEDCFYDTFTYCEHCGKVVYRDDTALVHSDPYESNDVPEEWCEHCVDYEAYTCHECGEHFKYCGDGEETVDGWVDNGCLEGNYVRCADCGDWIRSGNSYSDGCDDYCEYCWENNHGDDVIHGYHDGPRPTNWHGSDYSERNKILHTGVELELCDGGQDDEKAYRIIEATGFDVDESFVCEYDGSLRDGFEIISSTATTDFHVKEYGWDKLMAKAVELGYTSHDSGCAGLHVHLDREYFDGMINDPEDVLTIIVMNNADWLKKFSRRKNWSYCAFPSAYTFESKNFKPRLNGYCNDDENVLAEKRRFMRGHNACMNFSGYSTMEIRFNRGTLKFTTFVAIMQFIQMLADFTKKSRINRACNIRLRHFKALAKVRGYVEFLNYLAERHID